MRRLLRPLGGCLLLGFAVAAAPPSAADEPAAGKLLIATHRIEGSVFSEAVVLLLDYGPEGALGLIVNRPLGAPLARLLPDLEGLEGRADRAWLGGPVSPEALMLLVRSSEPVEGARPVAPEVYTSTSITTLEALLGAERPRHFRAYVGYAGWAPGQLEVELARGSWVLAPSAAASIFPEDPAGLWRRLLHRYQPLRVERRGQRRS
jgi:putative transcriptional regulator